MEKFNVVDENYKVLLSKVYNPIIDKIRSLKEKEAEDYFKVILDAAERSLRLTLFMSPPPSRPELNFKKEISEDDMYFWLQTVSLAFMAYSYYFYEDSPEVRKDPTVAKLGNRSYDLYWQMLYDSYNFVFNKHISKKEIDYYAAGLKEDCEKGYSKFGNFDRARELSNLDALTIASELLDKIWKEKLPNNAVESLRDYQPGGGFQNVDTQVVRALFLGGVRIWGTYREFIQPFLTKLVTG